MILDLLCDMWVEKKNKRGARVNSKTKEKHRKK